jgi:hypothetical protein
MVEGVRVTSICIGHRPAANLDDGIGRRKGEFPGPLVTAPRHRDHLGPLKRNKGKRLALAYNGRVDRANAIRLLKALVAAGANSNTLRANAWVDDIAHREASLRGTELSSALAYAEGQGWIADGPRQGWTIITREGERTAGLRIV